jgi:hypothetical protein
MACPSPSPLFSVLAFKPGALQMLGKHSTTKLCPQFPILQTKKMSLNKGQDHQINVSAMIKIKTSLFREGLLLLHRLILNDVLFFLAAGS